MPEVERRMLASDVLNVGEMPRQLPSPRKLLEVSDGPKFNQA